ncbi:MAG: hypothetical protein ACLT9Y_03075 [Peptostreptococcus anaerobius]
MAIFSSLTLTACSLPGLGGEASKGDIVIAGEYSRKTDYYRNSKADD